ncbi:MAG TPA: aspartyl protease family protein [Rhizomicrobium sp.]|nr:aspartyl protease family protein [Rhizomicrobium sp.]
MAIRRITPIIALYITFLYAPAARAQESCGPLKIVDIVHMIPTLTGDADIVPIVIGGKPRNFLLDTGGYLSQISRPLARELNLSIRQGNSQLYDAVGNISRDQANVADFGLGEITDKDVSLIVSSSLGSAETRGIEGLLAPDRLTRYDAELDFSTDTLNLFSPDHCPGHVVYWSAPAVAAVPVTLEQMRFTRDGRETNILRETPIAPSALTALQSQGFHIFVPVTLDGQEIKALIDTGATNTALRMDIAQRRYGLVMGSEGTPGIGNLNGEAGLKIYSHLFKSLSFGDVIVSNPHLTIIPNAMGRNGDLTPLAADRTKTERDLVNAPELIIGMDVLRRLRIYFAFQEGKMYVSPSSAPQLGAVQPYGPEFQAAMLKRLDTIIAASPDDASALNDRCFWRGIAKSDLDGALADCDKSLKLEPGVPATLDSRAFVLFQQEKYQDAVKGYDAALQADAHQAPSLFMRGLAKGKLGDTSGKDADIAAATKDDPSVPAEFKRIGIED